jgi:hypothetical protein
MVHSPFLPRLGVVAAVLVLTTVVQVSSANAVTFEDLQWCATRLPDLVHVPSTQFVSRTIKRLSTSNTEGLDLLLQMEGQLSSHEVSSQPIAGLAPPPQGATDRNNNTYLPFWRRDVDAAVLRRCGFLRSVTALAEARRQILGIDPGMVFLGQGGTPGNTVRESNEPPNVPTTDPPLGEQPPTSVTESVVTLYGCSLMRRPAILASNLLITRPPKPYFVDSPVSGSKLKRMRSMTERSASFRDPASGRVHVARVRYVKNWYAGEFPSTFAEVVKSLRGSQRDRPTHETVVLCACVRHHRGFLAMGAGNWDIYFMQGRALPGLNQTRNVTAAMEYWDASIRVLARMVDDARRSTALGRVPIFWRDQPLPRCDSHRFSRPAKASLRCVDVLRPVVIPFYRKRASEILTAAGLVVLPVDHLVHPTERHSSSTALPATKSPPPWQTSLWESLGSRNSSTNGRRGAPRRPRQVLLRASHCHRRFHVDLSVRHCYARFRQRRERRAHERER